MRPLPKSLQKAISGRYAAIVEEGWSEQDEFFSDRGWAHWVYLKRGWHNALVDPIPGLHIIHEASVREVLEQLKAAQPCDCDECRKGVR